MKDKEEKPQEAKPEESKVEIKVKVEDERPVEPKLKLVSKKKVRPRPQWWQTSANKAVLMLCMAGTIFGLIAIIAGAFEGGLVIGGISVIIAFFFFLYNRVEEGTAAEFKSKTYSEYHVPGFGFFLYQGEDDMLYIRILDKKDEYKKLDIDRDIFTHYILSNKKFRQFINHQPEIKVENDPVEETEKI